MEVLCVLHLEYSTALAKSWSDGSFSPECLIQETVRIRVTSFSSLNPIAPIRQCVFRRNASDDESQGSCLSSLYSLSVLPKLGQMPDFRRNCLVKETLKPGEVSLVSAQLCLWFALGMNLLTFLGLYQLYPQNFLAYTVGRRGDKTDKPTHGLFIIAFIHRLIW